MDFEWALFSLVCLCVLWLQNSWKYSSKIMLKCVFVSNPKPAGQISFCCTHTHKREKNRQPNHINSSFFVDWPLLHRQFCCFLFLDFFLLWFFLRTNGIVWTTEQSIVELQIKMLRGKYDFFLFLSYAALISMDFDFSISQPIKD